MKTKTKFIIGISTAVLLIGGIAMTETKTPINIWKSTEPQNTEEKQLDYLKDHEQEMTDFIKTQNPKVMSVQYDWKSIQTGVTGNGTPQGAGNYLLLFGYVNGDKNLDFRIDFNVDNTGLPKMNSMTLGQPLTEF